MITNTIFRRVKAHIVISTLPGATVVLASESSNDLKHGYIDVPSCSESERSNCDDFRSGTYTWLPRLAAEQALYLWSCCDIR